MNHLSKDHMNFIGWLDSIEGRLTQAESLCKLPSDYIGELNLAKARAVLEGMNGEIHELGYTHPILADRLEHRLQNCLARLTQLQVV